MLSRIPLAQKMNQKQSILTEEEATTISSIIPPIINHTPIEKSRAMKKNTRILPGKLLVSTTTRTTCGW